MDHFQSPGELFLLLLEKMNTPILVIAAVAFLLKLWDWITTLTNFQKRIIKTFALLVAFLTSKKVMRISSSKFFMLFLDTLVLGVPVVLLVFETQLLTSLTRASIKDEPFGLTDAITWIIENPNYERYPESIFWISCLIATIYYYFYFSGAGPYPTSKTARTSKAVAELIEFVIRSFTGLLFFLIAFTSPLWGLLALVFLFSAFDIFVYGALLLALAIIGPTAVCIAPKLIKPRRDLLLLFKLDFWMEADYLDELIRS